MLNGITLGIVMIVVLLIASFVLTLLINLLLVPLFKTPKDVLSEIIDMMNLKKEDHIADLGSGDGRILLEAHRVSKCKCTGYDISPIMLIVAKTKRILHFPLSKDFNFEAKDLFKADLKDFSKIYCYLDKESTNILQPRLKNFIGKKGEVYSYRYAVEKLKNEKRVILSNGESLYIYKV